MLLIGQTMVWGIDAESRTYVWGRCEILKSLRNKLLGSRTSWWFTSDPSGQRPGLNQFLTMGQPRQRVHHFRRGRRIQHEHKLLQLGCHDQRKAPPTLFPSRVCQILCQSRLDGRTKTRLTDRRRVAPGVQRNPFDDISQT